MCFYIVSFALRVLEEKCVCLYGRKTSETERSSSPCTCPISCFVDPQGWSRQGQGHPFMCWGQARVAPAMTAAHRESPGGSVLPWVCLMSVQLSPVSCPTQGSCVIRMLFRQQKISCVLT